MTNQEISFLRAGICEYEEMMKLEPQEAEFYQNKINELKEKLGE